jgi:sodium-dependent dicarboxylate transporter 2/3/5
MLPVATAANTFAYGTGFVAQKDMIRTGLRLNFISIVVISLLLWWLGVLTRRPRCAGPSC